MKKLNLLPISFWVLLLLTGIALSSCKKSASGSNVNNGITGKWLGTIASSNSPKGQNSDIFTLTLEQSGTNLTGSFINSEIDNANRTTIISGTLTGTVNGNSIEFTLTNSNSADTANGPLVGLGTINAAGNSMSGTYTSSGTNGSSGTWSLTKN